MIKATCPATHFPTLKTQLSNPMHTRCFSVLCWLACVAISASTMRCGVASEFEHEDAAVSKSLLQSNCFDCHANGESEGGLRLDALLEEPSTEENRQRWWKVLNNVRAGTMPPPDSGYGLNKQERETLGRWLKYDAMQIDIAQPDPGRVTIRRLNRREYSNTIRDLMGVDFNADIVFPPDDTGFGFDNIGDALSLSPMLVEKYVAASAEIVSMAVPRSHLVVPKRMLYARDFQDQQGGNAVNMRMQKARRVLRTFDISTAGNYSLAIDLRTHGTFEFSPQRCELVCLLDGQQLFKGEYGWDESKLHKYEFQYDWEIGSHELVFELTPIPLDPSVTVTDEMRSEIDVQSVAIIGPTQEQHWQQPPNYKRFFPKNVPPTDPIERRRYAQEVMSEFALRAYRRPAAPDAVERMVQIAESVYRDGNESFESGIAQAMISVLASPRFLFKLEGIVESDSAARFPRIDEYALASRLSYFLWSTMPDEELFRLAHDGQLRQQLDTQLSRMLNDKRSSALIQNFVGQWLRTRDVEKVSIDALAVFGLQKEFDAALAEFRKRRGRPTPPGEPVDPAAEEKRKRFREIAAVRDTLDGDVRQAMRRETEMLFEHIASEDRSLIEMIDPGYTFVNEKLAKHYGIPDVRGNEMRRVDLPPNSPRGGILTHGSMLTVTSNPTRTSPVKRGLFVLENILGTPTPPAPANVPALEDAAGRFGGREPSLRELLAAHRESALCSSCHSRMDPLGLALENYNALGMWRDKENDQMIDGTGQLITGEKFSNVQELRKIIANERAEDFYRCLSQKMLTFAIGRGIEYNDEHTLDKLVLDLTNNQGKFRTLIQGIVHADAFQRQRPTVSQRENPAGEK